MEPKWTNVEEMVNDLTYLDPLGAKYGPEHVELITGGGRGSGKCSARNSRSSPRRPGLLDRNGELIEFDDEELRSFEDAEVEDEDWRENQRILKEQMRKSLCNPMDNTQLENYVRAKAQFSPKKWNSAGSSSSSPFFKERASSLDGKKSKRTGHKKEMKKEFKPEEKKSERSKRESKSSVETKKSSYVFEVPAPPGKKDRSSQNALISNLLEKKNIIPKPLAATNENSKISQEKQPEKYVPPYRRNQKEIFMMNEKEEASSDADVIIEDDSEDSPKIKSNFEIPNFLEKLSPPAATNKPSKEVIRETEWDIKQFKDNYIQNFISKLRDENEEEVEEEEEKIINIGKETVASIEDKNKMELNNNCPEKEQKYENLAKKVLKNKNSPRKKDGLHSVYDFHKYDNPGRQNSQNGQRCSKGKNSGTQSPYIKSKVFYNRNRRKGKKGE